MTFDQLYSLVEEQTPGKPLYDREKQPKLWSAWQRRGLQRQSDQEMARIRKPTEVDKLAGINPDRAMSYWQRTQADWKKAGYQPNKNWARHIQQAMLSGKVHDRANALRWIRTLGRGYAAYQIDRDKISPDQLIPKTNVTK